MKRLWKRIPRRWKRVAAFALGSGIAFMGAGNLMGINALTSALFGATGAIFGLLGALSFTYAGKDEGVTDADFDRAINEAIQAVSSKANGGKDK